MAQWLTNLTRNYEVVGSIPGLAQGIKDLLLLWCGSQRRLGTCVAVALEQAGSYSCDQPPWPGTLHVWPEKTKKKTKKPKKKKKGKKKKTFNVFTDQMSNFEVSSITCLKYFRNSYLGTLRYMITELKHFQQLNHDFEFDVHWGKCKGHFKNGLNVKEQYQEISEILKES